MNRKLTALLLAMIFVLSAVLPTVATAESGNAGSNKTASISAEKPKEEKPKAKTLLAKWRKAKEAKATESGKKSSKKTSLKASESKDAESVSVKTAGVNDTDATETKKEVKIFLRLKDVLGNELTGEKLKIKRIDDSKDASIKEVKSGEAISVKELTAGKYKIDADLSEGYKLAGGSVEFEVTEKGEIKADKDFLKTEDGKQYLTMVVDFPENKTFFSVKDNRGNELAGVKLQVKEVGSERVVKEWESGKSPLDVKLEAGEYEFSQVDALPGHQLASPIRFKVADGKIDGATAGLSAVGGQQVLSLVNGFEKHEIKFRRVKADGKDLVGTAVEIYRDGTKVAFWKSGTEANKPELEPGTYRYHEAGIPDGHKKVADFEFEVKADGSISLGAVQAGDTVKLKDGAIIVSGNEAKADPKEKPKQQKGAESIWIEFSLTKRSGGELSGALVEIHQGSTMLESWTSTNLSYLSRFKPGTYRFHVKTVPAGFAAPKDFDFTVNQDGSVKLGTIPAGETVTVKGGLITVTFETKAAAAAIAGGTTAQGGKKSNLPKTGDGISPVVYAAAIGVVGAVTLGIGLKKRREEIDEAK